MKRSIPLRLLESEHMEEIGAVVYRFPLRLGHWVAVEGVARRRLRQDESRLEGHYQMLVVRRQSIKPRFAFDLLEFVLGVVFHVVRCG